ncbi:hypothetical protein ACOME3_005703 [Neoechinorhynchus agilis]
MENVNNEGCDWRSKQKGQIRNRRSKPKGKYGNFVLTALKRKIIDQNKQQKIEAKKTINFSYQNSDRSIRSKIRSIRPKLNFIDMENVNNEGCHWRSKTTKKDGSNQQACDRNSKAHTRNIGIAEKHWVNQQFNG